MFLPSNYGKSYTHFAYEFREVWQTPNHRYNWKILNFIQRGCVCHLVEYFCNIPCDTEGVCLFANKKCLFLLLHIYEEKSGCNLLQTT